VGPGRKARRAVKARWRRQRITGADRKVTPLNIKDREVYELARKLAAVTGETLTEAVRKSLRERLVREQNRRPDPLMLEKVREIVDRMAALPVIDDRSPDEIIGYDEWGVPR